MASELWLEAVGIHFSVKKKPESTSKSNSCTNCACVSGSFASPHVIALATDWLSTLIKT